MGGSRLAVEANRPALVSSKKAVVAIIVLLSMNATLMRLVNVRAPPVLRSPPKRCIPYPNE